MELVEEQVADVVPEREAVDDLVDPVVHESEAEEQMDEEAGDEEDAGEVDLADEEAIDDQEAGAGDGDENADPNDGGSTAGPTAAKSRAPTCPLDLPLSVVRRMMKAAAPNKRVTPDLVAAFARSAGTFGLYLLSACQDAAQDTGRTTIRPSEVISGLVACGFPELAEEARVTLGIATAGKRGKKLHKKN